MLIYGCQLILENEAQQTLTGSEECGGGAQPPVNLTIEESHIRAAFTLETILRYLAIYLSELGTLGWWRRVSHGVFKSRYGFSWFPKQIPNNNEILTLMTLFLLLLFFSSPDGLLSGLCTASKLFPIGGW